MLAPQACALCDAGTEFRTDSQDRVARISRAFVRHTEDVLKFQEMRQLGCFLRAQPRLSFALDEFSNALLSFSSIRP